ncbi:hypothetical protein GH714_018767 [Hevea brasiliensis]|uniref:Phosphatidic acid phosphatase type 2/haloperoxidase domain-containing protein n=1 Tax=Hevea brasiliensis TaxID=3981 RepID=A0A6A6NCW2_HEVBR|nr:hypothetical protein GH714_018767 [Hevea brasiliensis]
MREVDLGAHTIRSHGAKVARNHMHDWLILLLLVVTEIVLYIIHPFYRFVGKDMMEDLKYPFKDNTVPTWSVPRACGKIMHYFLPLLAAALVGISRVDDYWHHWQDVFVGAILGLVVSAFCYMQFFPPPYSEEGWGPYAYFQALEESHSNTNAGQAANALNMQAMDVEVVSLQLRQNGNEFTSLDELESGRRALFEPKKNKQLAEKDAAIKTLAWQSANLCDLKSLLLLFVCPLNLVSFPSANVQIWIQISDKMPEIQLGAHTVRSHGVKVARTHMHDWLILLLLVVIDVILNVIEPFHRFVGRDMMTDLSYPLKDNTVPFWAVPIVAILLPFVIILVYYFIRRDVYDLHHAILGLLFSVLITGVITDAIKDAVGRPRPDFFWRCFPDGKGVFNNVTTDVMCTGVKSVIKEGHKSFPSGHTSWSFAGLGFLSWADSCFILLLAIFPPPYDIDGWGPHAYFQMLAESRNGSESYNNMNCLNVRQSELQSVYIDSQHQNVLNRDTSPILEGAEGERRH